MATIAPVQTMVDRGNDNSRKIMIFSSDGKFYDYRNASSDSSPSTYAASWTNGDVIGMLIDMDQPGVETKPIKLISGKSPFCETFFTDAVVPKANLVHDLNKGWDVAKNLLQHERKMLASMGLGGSAAGGKGKGKSGSGLANLSKKYVESSDGKISDEGFRQKIAKSDMDAHAFGLTLRRASEEAKNSNHGPSAATSIFKFLHALIFSFFLPEPFFCFGLSFSIIFDCTSNFTCSLF